MHVAAIHPLTPGSPAYAIAKVGAIGGLIALRVVLSKRAKRSPEPEPAVETERPAQAHPVSAKKARRRSRKRR
jgi:hypothetical protein